MIYIASPFTHSDILIERARYVLVSKYTNKLLISGVAAFSPIVYGYHFHSTYKIASDAKTWQDFNFAMLSVAESLNVYMLDGWKTSLGVRAEINRAKQLKLPISYTAPVL